MPINLIGDNSGLDGLAGQTAANLSSTQSVTAAERNFQMTKVQLRLITRALSQAEAVLLPQATYCLVLANGLETTASMKAALDGVFHDFTPADGGNSLEEDQLLQGRIIRILFPENQMVVKELVAAEHGSLWTIDFAGAPLDNKVDGSGSSWTFPKGEGWQWFWYNYGQQTLDDSMLTNGLIRYWGKWFD